MSQKVPMCKFYLNGSCRFGDRCHFSHSSIEYLNDLDSESSEDESFYIPSTHRFVSLKSETDGRETPRRETFRGEKYGFTSGRVVYTEPQQGLHRYGFSSRGQAVRDEPHRQCDTYRSNIDISRSSSDHSSLRHRLVDSSRSVNWQAPRYEPEEDSQEADSSSSLEEVREVVDKIRQEAQQIENENMWPLTSLSVLKNGTNVPGWVDYSPEEMRVAAYSAEVLGCIDEYKTIYKKLKKEAELTRRTFLFPKNKKKAENTVWDMLNEENDGSSQDGCSEALEKMFCSFGSACSSAFCSTGAPLGFNNATNTSTTFTGSEFGYKMENKNCGSDCEMDIPNAPSATESSRANSLFTENLFGKVPLLSAPRETFHGIPAPTSGASTSGGCIQSGKWQTYSGAEDSPTSALDDGIYTPIDQLSQSDLEQFKAATFTLDKLPLVPPPRELA